MGRFDDHVLLLSLSENAHLPRWHRDSPHPSSLRRTSYVRLIPRDFFTFTSLDSLPPLRGGSPLSSRSKRAGWTFSISLREVAFSTASFRRRRDGHDRYASEATTSILGAPARSKTGSSGLGSMLHEANVSRMAPTTRFRGSRKKPPMFLVCCLLFVAKYKAWKSPLVFFSTSGCSFQSLSEFTTQWHSQSKHRSLPVLLSNRQSLSLGSPHPLPCKRPPAWALSRRQAAFQALPLNGRSRSQGNRRNRRTD